MQQLTIHHEFATLLNLTIHPTLTLFRQEPCIGQGAILHTIALVTAAASLSIHFTALGVRITAKLQSFLRLLSHVVFFERCNWDKSVLIFRHHCFELKKNRIDIDNEL